MEVGAELNACCCYRPRRASPLVTVAVVGGLVCLCSGCYSREIISIEYLAPEGGEKERDKEC